MTFHRIKLAIKNYIKNFTANNNHLQNQSRPFVPSNISNIIRYERDVKSMYTTLFTENKAVTKIPKWDIEFNQNINDNFWKNSYEACFKTLKENYLIWFQFKILTRILGTQDLLFKMNISNNQSCNLCKEANETMVHLFIECKVTKNLWNYITLWATRKLNSFISFEEITIIFGCLTNDRLYYNKNTILLVAKSMC